MISLEKVIERGEQSYANNSYVRWIKFSDGIYLLGGKYFFPLTESKNTYTFSVNLPIQVGNVGNTSVVVTNVYRDYQFANWTATMMQSNELRLDVNPSGGGVMGLILGCSFILIGK